MKSFIRGIIKIIFSPLVMLIGLPIFIVVTIMEIGGRHIQFDDPHIKLLDFYKGRFMCFFGLHELIYFSKHFNSYLEYPLNNDDCKKTLCVHCDFKPATLNDRNKK